MAVHERDRTIVLQETTTRLCAEQLIKSLQEEMKLHPPFSTIQRGLMNEAAEVRAILERRQ
jgi:hypothetical protein